MRRSIALPFHDLVGEEVESPPLTHCCRRCSWVAVAGRVWVSERVTNAPTASMPQHSSALQHRRRESHTTRRYEAEGVSADFAVYSNTAALSEAGDKCDLRQTSLRVGSHQIC